MELDPPPTVPVVQVPTLGIWGSEDRFMTEDSMTRSAGFVSPGCWTYTRWDGIGHWIPLKTGQELAKICADFFTTVADAPARRRRNY